MQGTAPSFHGEFAVHYSALHKHQLELTTETVRDHLRFQPSQPRLKFDVQEHYSAHGTISHLI